MPFRQKSVKLGRCSGGLSEPILLLEASTYLIALLPIAVVPLVEVETCANEGWYYYSDR